MGNSSVRQAGVQDPTVFFQTDLRKFILESKIGSGKFMKSYKMKVDGASVVVKVYLGQPEEELHYYFASSLTYLWRTLSPIIYPNLLPYQMWIRSSSRFPKTNIMPVYLIRQFLYSNLHDRLATRPFLLETEKLWLLFQLFKCLEITHGLGIVHGDVKPENVLCTTWNWIILTDFASFKPVTIPDDDPTDFQYFFASESSSTGRQRCYIAPERFQPSSEIARQQQEQQKSSLSSLDDSMMSVSVSELRDIVQNKGGAKGGAISKDTSDVGTEKGYDRSLRDRDSRGGAESASGSATTGTGTDTDSVLSLSGSADVFSLGCTMAEVLLDGEPLLDLPTMLRYVKSTGISSSSSSNSSSDKDKKESGSAASTTGGAHTHTNKNNSIRGGGGGGGIEGAADCTPITLDDEDLDLPTRAVLNRISNRRVKEAIIHMTQRDAASRLSVQDYRLLLEGAAEEQRNKLTLINEDNNTSTSSATAGGTDINRDGIAAATVHSDSDIDESLSSPAPFPEYFGSSLYPLFLKMHWEGVTPDDRIAMICQGYGRLISSVTGISDDTGSSFFTNAVEGVLMVPTHDEQSKDNSSSSNKNSNNNNNINKDVSSATATADFAIDARLRVVIDTSSSSSGIERGEGEDDDGSSGSHVTTTSSSSSLQQCPLLAPHIASASGVNIASSPSSSVPSDIIQGKKLPHAPPPRFQSQSQSLHSLSVEELLQQCKQLLSDAETSFLETDSSTETTDTTEKNKTSEDSAATLAPGTDTEREGEGGTKTDGDRVERKCDIAGVGWFLSADLPAAASSASSSSGTGTSNAKKKKKIRERERINRTSSIGTALPARIYSKGIVVLVQLVTANFRHLRSPRLRVVALMLLSRMGLRSEDSIILQRIIPTVLIAITDSFAPLRVVAVRALTALLAGISSSSLTAFEANLFPQYIFPALQGVARDPETSVRVAFAECVGGLAETARRFLDRVHLMAMKKARLMNAVAAAVGTRTSTATPVSDASAPLSKDVGKLKAATAAASSVSEHQKSSVSPAPAPASVPASAGTVIVNFAYDEKLQILHTQVSRWIRDLVLDSSAVSTAPPPIFLDMSGMMVGGAVTGAAAVQGRTSSSVSVSCGGLIRRALLLDIEKLCLFFGQEATMDLLLTQLLTFLNDQDWELRLAFCSKIPAVCAFVGATVTSECILPCLENVLVDVEERVVAQAARCTGTLVELSLLTPSMVVDAVKSLSPLLIHPSDTIRREAMAVVDAAVKALGNTDATVFLLPILQPILHMDLTGAQLSAECISMFLLSPMHRHSYQKAVSTKMMEQERLIYGSSTYGYVGAGNSVFGDIRPSVVLGEKERGGGGGEGGGGGGGGGGGVSVSGVGAVLADECSEGDADVLNLANDIDEPLKLQFMENYLSLAAREAANRTTTSTQMLHLRNSSSSNVCATVPSSSSSSFPRSFEQKQQQQPASSSGREVLLSTAIDGSSVPSPSEQKSIHRSEVEKRLASSRAVTVALSSSSSALASEHSSHTQTLLIPHQKYGSEVFPAISEAMRAQALELVRSSSSRSRSSSCSSSSNTAATAYSSVRDNTGTTSKVEAGNAKNDGSKDKVAITRSPRISSSSTGSTSTARSSSAASSLSAAAAAGAAGVSSAKLKSLFGVVGNQDATRTLSGASSSSTTSAATNNGTSGTMVQPSSIININTNISSNIATNAASANAISADESVDGFRTTINNNRTASSLTDNNTGSTGDGTVAVVGSYSSSIFDTQSESAVMLRRIRAFNIPPLPPNLGSGSGSAINPSYSSSQYYSEDNKPSLGSGASVYTDTAPSSSSSSSSSSSDTSNRRTWRHREGILLATLHEHSRAVNRLAVAPDGSYFASASSDRTVKIWQLKGLDRTAFPRSVVTYTGHRSAVLDVISLENSQSMASCSEDGAIHVWHVELAGGGSSHKNNNNNSSSSNNHHYHNRTGSSSTVTPSSSSAAATVDPWGPIDTSSLSISHTGSGSSVSVSGLSVVRTINQELLGAVVSLQHFNGDVASVIAYATQLGTVGGWDLRSTQEAFSFKMRPELGYTTSLSVSPDRAWLVAGTSRGYIALWDLRHNTVCRLWQHSGRSPIHRLACSKVPAAAAATATTATSTAGNSSSSGVGVGVGRSSSVSSSSSPSSSHSAYLFTAAGSNEASAWHLPGYSETALDCLKCFRAVPLSNSRSVLDPLPTLTEVQLPDHPNAPIYSAIVQAAGTAKTEPGNKETSSVDRHSIRALMGRISSSNSSYLITGGTDRQIRYWDFNSSSSKCFTISGLAPAQPKPLYEAANTAAADNNNTGRLVIAYDAAEPSADILARSQLPLREARGPSMPSSKFKDAILDLKTLEQPTKQLMLSCGRDCDIKIWR